jgi:hypothetical protein
MKKSILKQQLTFSAALIMTGLHVHMHIKNPIQCEYGNKMQRF